MPSFEHYLNTSTTSTSAVVPLYTELSGSFVSISLWDNLLESLDCDSAERVYWKEPKKKRTVIPVHIPQKYMRVYKGRLFPPGKRCG